MKPCAATPHSASHLEAQGEGQRHDPLPDRDERQHPLHQVGRLLRHAAAAAGGTEAATPARERDEPVVRPVSAAHAHEAVRGHSALDERSQLRLQEARQAAAAECPREEGLQVRAHDAVQEPSLAPPGKRH
jgi:hypothetical protein